jgi:hypothetical protein
MRPLPNAITSARRRSSPLRKTRRRNCSANVSRLGSQARPSSRPGAGSDFCLWPCVGCQARLLHQGQSDVGVYVETQIMFETKPKNMSYIRRRRRIRRRHSRRRRGIVYALGCRRSKTGGTAVRPQGDRRLWRNDRSQSGCVRSSYVTAARPANARRPLPPAPGRVRPRERGEAPPPSDGCP